MNAYLEFLAVENSPMPAMPAEPLAVDWSAVAWSIASNLLAAAQAKQNEGAQ